jgi:hypothetical protein
MVHVAAGAVLHHRVSARTRLLLVHPPVANLEQLKQQQLSLRRWKAANVQARTIHGLQQTLQQQQLQQQRQLAVTMMMWMLMCLMRPALF